MIPCDIKPVPRTKPFFTRCKSFQVHELFAASYRYLPRTAACVFSLQGTYFTDDTERQTSRKRRALGRENEEETGSAFPSALEVAAFESLARSHVSRRCPRVWRTARNRLSSSRTDVTASLTATAAALATTGVPARAACPPIPVPPARDPERDRIGFRHRPNRRAPHRLPGPPTGFRFLRSAWEFPDNRGSA